MENLQEKSTKDLELESTILKLQLLRIEKELNKRKERERRATTGLKDKRGHTIKIGDKVKLLTKSSKKSPFADQQYAKVVGVAHNGTRVEVSLLGNAKETTNRTPSNVEVTKDKGE